MFMMLSSFVLQRLPQEVFGALDLYEHRPTLLLGIGFLLGFDQSLPHPVVDWTGFVHDRFAVEPHNASDRQDIARAEIEIEHRDVFAVGEQRGGGAAAALPERDVAVIVDLRAAA